MSGSRNSKRLLSAVENTIAITITKMDRRRRHRISSVRLPTAQWLYDGDKYIRRLENS